MIPNASREQIEAALRRFDAEERSDDSWRSNRSHKYALQHDGKLYPVKRIISLATGADVRTFNGGGEANKYVREREFEVIPVPSSAASLRQSLVTIFEEYGSSARGPFGKSEPAYEAFSKAAQTLAQLECVQERSDLKVKPSAGQGNWANVPWIALMDKRETTSTQHGVYVVYLFREDMSGVYLTYNQGVTELFSEHGSKRARELLAEEAGRVRALTPGLAEDGFALDNSTIDLGASTSLGRRYEESTIGHKFYPADELPTDEQLEADLETVLQAYDQYLDSERVMDDKLRAEQVDIELNDAKRLQATLDWIRAQGYNFEPWQLASFVAAAKTKPFVILAGVSGTGKSKLPQLLAEATGAREETVPVRPDWTDSADLLGYRDLHGRFRAGPLMEFCRDAEDEPDDPAFFVVDEMNLARVEYYFAEVLSRIEDDPDLGGRRPLVSTELDADDAVWADVSLPSNVIIVGTVNMDETTHGFSKKVLDRAFTLEFSRVDLAAWEASDVADSQRPSWTGADWKPRARRLSQLDRLTQRDRELINSTITALLEANEILQQAQMQVGYRVRDELALFRLHAVPYEALFVDANGEPVDPLDVGLTMKLLPRISGGSNLVRRVIRQLLGWANVGEAYQDDREVDAAVEAWENAGAGDVLPEAVYPRTAARLCLMWQRLQSEGFTSYWL